MVLRALGGGSVKADAGTGAGGRTDKGPAVCAEAEGVRAAGRTEGGTDPACAVRVGVLVVSDRSSRGEREDRGGPAVLSYLAEALACPWAAVTRVVPDEVDVVRAALVELVDEAGCCLVITTGGTGPAPRDVTPEATLAVLDKELPGFGEAMRAVSLASVPTAVLSRQTAGTRGRALVVNLPGSPGAVAECLDAVFAAVPDCIDLVGGPRLETRPERVRAYRPHD